MNAYLRHVWLFTDSSESFAVNNCHEMMSVIAFFHGSSP